MLISSVLFVRALTIEERRMFLSVLAFVAAYIIPSPGEYRSRSDMMIFPHSDLKAISLLDSTCLVRYIFQILNFSDTQSLGALIC